MDHSNSTIFKANRERGQHLRFEDRCTIKVLHKQGYSLRRIAKEINCSPSTVMYELRKGTAAKTTSKGRPSTYMPSRGQQQYELNRKNCH